MQLRELVKSIVDGSVNKVREFTQLALEKGIDPRRVIEEAFTKGMNEVGDQFERQEVYLPELIFAAKAMQAGMEILEPRLLSSQAKPLGKVVLGTVKGDQHDIGIKLVGLVLKGSGFEVIHLGVDVPPEKFVEASRGDTLVVGMSALLGTTMANMKLTIEALEQAGLKHKVRTIIGGAIVTQAFADKIGADAYASNAFAAAKKVMELLNR
jgi:5-methyltetrahydrofolate--homocysteine methyltransferase